MAIDLTRERRLELWQTLTPLQQETLQKVKKYQMQSLFLTENLLKDDEWLFVDFKENLLYPNGPDEDKLYCRCGRELKYQFVLVSKNTDEKLTLGSTHFAQHTGIDPKVAQQVQSGVHQLDRGIDLILLSIDQGLRFPHRYYNHFINRGLKNQCSQGFLTRLTEFSQADLPLYEEDNQQLIQLLRKSGFTFKNEAPATIRDKNALKQLIILLQSYEIGEAIIIEEIRSKLAVPTSDLLRWLGFLSGSRFVVQVKRVNDSYYRIA
ncbi:hypothetical protein JZO70_01520 [Enterococcus sp. 669A]|uniref:Uncharacterized protein n=1 Tax=Candidatus Enterococcus moelleringii TaxID=2815325 RepID=A0ABS3L5E0_9ENTE|nr:hypothetical protein [Enterococcus sp. 669A]MBO1304823.1 hypothetical protein [Enterococcus sp. 669A]